MTHESVVNVKLPFLVTSDVSENGLYKLASGGMASEVLCPHLSRLQRFVHGIAYDLRVARQIHAPQHVD